MLESAPSEQGNNRLDAPLLEAKRIEHHREYEMLLIPGWIRQEEDKIEHQVDWQCFFDELPACLQICASVEAIGGGCTLFGRRDDVVSQKVVNTLHIVLSQLQDAWLRKQLNLAIVHYCGVMLPYCLYDLVDFYQDTLFALS